MNDCMPLLVPSTAAEVAIGICITLRVSYRIFNLDAAQAQLHSSGPFLRHSATSDFADPVCIRQCTSSPQLHDA